MSHSHFSRPAVLNDNYKPLQNENPTLKFYLQEVFIIMDELDPMSEHPQAVPSKILTHLLDRYLKFNKLSGLRRTIEQQELVHQMRVWSSGCNEVKVAFQTLNNSEANIKPNDDLIWLLSAYCSVFPLSSQWIANKQIKNALMLCDINEVYFQAVCAKGKNVNELKRCLEVVFSTEEKQEVVLPQSSGDSPREKIFENALSVLDDLRHKTVEEDRLTLLKECVSQMTEKEMIDQEIVLKVNLFMNHREVDSVNAISETLKVVFTRLNNQWYNNSFLNEYLPLYLRHELKDAEILLPILVSKVDSTTQVMTCRSLLKSDCSRNPELKPKIDFVLTLLYKRSKELYRDIPGFGIGEYKFPVAAPSNKRTCSVM